MIRPTFLALLACIVTAFLAGCVTTGDLSPEVTAKRAAMMESIQNEPLGNYFIGRRFYKVDYKFWGYIRKPREPWTSAKLVMLNEQKHLAPDREGGTLGSDNGDEFKLQGYFSGDTVYEPASNSFYPEFVLTGYLLLNPTPAPIFHAITDSMNPARRIIAEPY